MSAICGESPESRCQTHASASRVDSGAVKGGAISASKTFCFPGNRI
jgi:hypothetical protein